jgi:hypothetical protein
VFTGVNPVFTPALNTVKEDEIFNIIEYSGDGPDGVNVLTQIQGGEGNIPEKAQEGHTQAPGNGHDNGTQESEPGNGRDKPQGLDLDEETKTLAEEFSVLLNPKTTLTPHLCRKGCKHYDPAGDPEGGNFREFCGRSNRTLVEGDKLCENYESNPRPSEAVLTF